MGKSTLVLLTLVLLSTSVAIAAPPPTLQGPIFVPGDGGHDEATGNQEDVAIAAGGGGFLTVWTDMRTAYADFQGHEQAGHDVYAARLDAAGNLVDAMPVILSQDAGSQQHPRVAWNGQNWLVVWENQVPSATGGSSPRKVFGARVAADGTVLDAPFEIFEAPDFAGAMTELEVAANGSDWLVVAQADSGGGLHGVRVAGSGTVLDPVPALLVAPLWFLYSDVSVHSAQGQYLLVYDGQSSFEARRFNPDLRPIGGTISLPVEEARVGTNGTDYFVVWDPPGLTAFGSPMTIDGTLTHPAGIPIMDSSWSTSNLSQVTWDGTNWWVAHPQPYPGGGLKLTRVSVSGTVLDSPPINVFELADEEFVGPYRVTGGASGGLQVVWADQDCGCPDEWDTSLRPWDIHGKNVSATGQLGTEEPLSCAGAAQTEPDLAAGPDQFLAVFSSEKADVKRILAQRLDGQGEAIDAEPIEIASGSYVTNPSVAWNGSLYMIAWDEFYYCVGGDPPPCGTFIQAVRMLPDGTVIDAEPITAMQANHADVAALGENFLVVGRDSFIYLHHEVVPLGVRVDGATGALLDTTPLVLGWSFAVDPQVTSFRDKWLVVFERRASHDENWGGSYFNFVTADGTVQFDKFATPAACGGATPKVSASGAGALVVCREGAPWHFLNDINGMMILPDETSGPGFEISGAVEEQRAPTVTWTGTEFLVVWEDKRNGVDYFDERTDLYGARVDMFGQVLDPDGLAIATSPSAEQHPALIHSGDDILLAASLFRDADTNYRLGVYHTPGTLNDPPEVSFAESATMGCSPFEVSFTDQSVGDVSSWYWSFGDGNTSTERNPTHVYAAPGAYSVYLTASGGSGPASHVKFDLVTVDQGTETDFWTPATSGCAPLDVNFYNTTIGDQTDWLWMFGDDTVSTEQVTTHTYEYPGDYTVMLTANGACGPDTAMKVEYIQIDRMCPIQDGAVEDYFVEGEVTGTYAGTHADDNLNTWQSIYEVSVPVEGGTTWLLEHRWRFEATGGTEGMEFYVDFYVYQDPDEEFIFEYSLDNVNFVPLLSISDPWSSEHRVPLPPGLQGTFWIRMIDSDRTTADTAKDFIFIYGMAVESGVPTPYHRVPATMGLQFAGPDSLQWMPAAAATQYDVLWGNLGDLRVNGSVGDAQCGWEDYPGTTLLEPSVPPAGAGYYYLVRGDAAQLAAGTLDNVPGLSTPEDRDQEAGTAGGLTCEDMP